MNAELYKNEKSSKFYIHLLIHGVPNFVFVYLFVIFVVVFVIVVVFGGLPLFLCFVLFCFFKTGFVCSFGACLETSSCRPG